jgi:hypothetical protein
MHRLLVAIVLFLASTPALATGLKSDAEALALSNRMMDTAMKQSPDAVFSQLKPYWPLDAAEIDGMASSAKLQWQIVETRFGKPVGYELVATERLGQSFVRYVYLQKFEHHALRWVFAFYRPKDVWLANSFKFDDQLDSLYSED